MKLIGHIHEPASEPPRESADDIRRRYEPEPMPSYESPADDGPSLIEQRKSYKAEQKAGGIEARLWANLSAWQKGESKRLTDVFVKACDNLGKAASAFMKGEIAQMKAGIAAQQAKSAHELRDHIETELSAAVRDIREVHADQGRIAERLVARAAERAVIQLSTEVGELRREVEVMKQERSLRAVR
ncbi:hypothetical protein [Ensifer canadensis]